MNPSTTALTARWIPIVTLVTALAACALDAPPPRDPGAPGPATWAQRVPGSTCADHAECDSVDGAGDGYCYAGDMGGLVFPDEGYCAVDDGTGEVCAIDADCPAGSLCIDIEGYRLCLPACGPGDTCPDHQACLTTFDGLELDAPVCLPGNASAVDGDACTAFYDCNASSTCWHDVEHPGGMCSAYGCELGTSAGCNGGTCIAFTEGLAGGTVCVATCATAGDCRADEGYVCHDPDGAGGASGYCRHPHVGDACAGDADCGAGWTCLADPAYPGGYCTRLDCPTPGSTAGCGSGAVCAAVDGGNACLDRCPTIGSSAGSRPGYVCTDVGAAVGGGQTPGA